MDDRDDGTLRDVAHRINLTAQGKRRLPVRRLFPSKLCATLDVFEEIAHGRRPLPIFPNGLAPVAQRHEVVMSLKTLGVIEIPNAAGSAFDHAAFDPKTRRVFIAHTARDCIEVIDHDAGKHIATLPGFPGAAGAVVGRWSGPRHQSRRGQHCPGSTADTLKTARHIQDRGAAKWRCDRRQVRAGRLSPASVMTRNANAAAVRTARSAGMRRSICRDGRAGA